MLQYDWLNNTLANFGTILRDKKINLYFHSHTGTTNEKFAGSSGTRTRTLGPPDRHSTHRVFESTGIGGELSHGENISST